MELVAEQSETGEEEKDNLELHDEEARMEELSFSTGSESRSLSMGD
jgi:hypothetical protein